ncbi:hypothetical protein VF_2031 [Aliivibrio fischeri ES114]|uniref:Replication-associated protein ORF2/G2P domain-containing protein n=1 Tax=Aliivibrio fischeri (strain ATCC 700601 / ES114) TaxID=312309 RepID=Q5E370_ALIF1|nr:hypothetical protein [Aliivibrio fischeri]AAW86526.1 hypothetical protein VF_2031 [Aliivibrio fischeri ES114]KLU79712.1 hypothetical protein AB192_06530 [Aliivibrio fischeri]
MGAIRPHDETKKNDACFRAGFLGSKIQEQPYSEQERELLASGVVKKLPVYDRILGSDKKSSSYDHVSGRKPQHIIEVERSTAHFEKLNQTPEHVREAAARIAEEYSLVNGRKSPTEEMSSRKWRIRSALRVLKRGPSYPVELASAESHFSHDVLYGSTERSTASILNEKGQKNPNESQLAPVSFQIQHREWSGQYRGQLITQTPASSAPDANVGERFTEKLTARSVSKIFSSAAYVSTCHEGFTTFLTLTFNKAQRLRIFGGMTDEYTTLSDERVGAHHPMRFRRNMITRKAGKNERKISAPVCDIAGPYTSIEIQDHAVEMNMNREIMGDYCLLSEKPKNAFTVEKTIETTIGKEVSRLLDGLKKMYQRGWIADHTIQVDEESNAQYCDLKRASVKPHCKAVATEFGPSFTKDDFHYIWVAECPANEDGEPNPHVHVLLKWTVEPHLFSAWAMRCEKIWGHGFAKLERIREPKAAGTYIIKAVGYAAKGDDASQGLVKGNRYSIAKCSRAPSWECIASFEANNITAIIKELGYKLEQWKKPLERSLNRLSYQKSQTIKAKAIAAKQPGTTEDKLKKMQSSIIRLEKQAQKVKQEMKSRQVHVSTENNFSISFDGQDAKQKVDDFLMWAAGARGWSMDCRDMDLSELKVEADELYQSDYVRFKDKRAYWQAVLCDSVPIEPDENEVNYWKSFTADYLEGKLTPMLH